jgi:hypothetical protein
MLVTYVLINLGTAMIWCRQDASISIVDGGVLAGEIPQGKLRLVQARARNFSIRHMLHMTLSAGPVIWTLPPKPSMTVRLHVSEEAISGLSQESGLRGVEVHDFQPDRQGRTSRSA